MRVGRTSIVHFGAKLLSTGLGFLATVYLARILGADILGTYFLIVAVFLWLKIFGTMGFSLSITKRLSEGARQDEHFTASIALQLVLLVAISIVVLLFRRPLNSYIGGPYAEVVVALAIAGGVFQQVTSALRGEDKVHIGALLDPTDRLFRALLQVSLVIAGFGLSGLLFGHLIAMLLAASVGVIFLSVRFSVPRREDFESILSFAKYSWIGGLSTRAFATTDTIVLGFFVSTTFIGIYEIAWNIASILAIFGTSISQTIFPQISAISSEKEDDDQIPNLINDALAFTGLFTIPGLFGAFLLGEWILGIYGAEFRQGTEVLVVLIFARLLAAYQGQFVNALSAIDRPDVAFRVNAVFLVANIGLNVVLVYLYGWIGAAVATATSAGITLLYGYLALRSIIQFVVPFGEIVRQIAGSFTMYGVIFALISFIDVQLHTAVVLVGIGAGVYFLILSVVSTRFRATVRANLPSDALRS